MAAVDTHHYSIARTITKAHNKGGDGNDGRTDTIRRDFAHSDRGAGAQFL